MIINDTNVRGIWSYSPSLVFEEGDFVVLGDQIYICKKSGVQGVNPSSNRDYFTEYPGNMVKSVEEYYSIIKDSEASDDLYISSRVLNEILQDSYFGLGDNGIIESVIESDGTLRGQIESLGSSEKVLDSLILAPGFNNGVVLVSRRFTDIQSLVGVLSFTLDTSSSSSEQQSEPKATAKINFSKCIGCGACADNCPTGAIEVVGSEVMYTCEHSDCGYIFSDEECYAIFRGAAGKVDCPKCGRPTDLTRKEIKTCRTNAARCISCGACLDHCPVDAISLVYEEGTINTAVETPEDNANQSFSNMISKYQVSDLEYVFVRQYSYRSGATGILHRIQELVDPDQGLIFFRHAVQRNGSLTMDSTEWTSCLSRDAIVMGRELNKIREKISKDETTATTSGFRYKSVPVTDRNNAAYFVRNEDLPIKSGDVKRIATLVIELRGSVISSYNASVDFSDDFTGDGKTYYVNDNVCFTIKSTVAGFDLRFEVDNGQELILKDIYCREAC